MSASSIATSALTSAERCDLKLREKKTKTALGKYSLVQKTQVSRHISRVWGPYFTASEAVVLRFIFSNTIEWGRDHIFLKCMDFVDGMKHTSGTGLSLRTVKRCLDSLAEKGAISKERRKRGLVLGINVRWNPAGTEECDPLALKPSTSSVVDLRSHVEKCQNGTEDDVRSAKTALPIEEEGHTIKKRVIHNSPVYDRAVNSEELQEDVCPEQKRASSNADNSSGSKNVSTRQLDPADTWSSAWRVKYPDKFCPPITKRSKQSSQLRSILMGHSNPTAFVEWLVNDWRVIVGARFAWMDQSPPPAYPSLGFVLTFKEHFVDAWNDRARLSEENRLNSTDRHRRRLMHAGLSFEEADREVKDRSSITTERETTAKTLANLNALLVAREEEKRALQNISVSGRDEPVANTPDAASWRRKAPDGFAGVVRPASRKPVDD